MAKYLLCLLLLFAQSALVQKAQPHKTVDDLDGSEWQLFSNAERDAYIAGYVSAMFQAESFATVCEAVAMAQKVAPDSPSADLARICVGESKEFHFAEVAGVAQYREGMNAFYKDFRNVQVPLSKAIGLVRDEIGGRSPEDVEKELAQWRQCHTDSSKCGTATNAEKPATPAGKQN
jgi:hypothetical protein